MPAIRRARSCGDLALVGRLTPSPSMGVPYRKAWGAGGGSWGRWAGRCRRALRGRRADGGDLPYNSWNDDGYMNMYASERGLSVALPSTVGL